MKLYSDEATIGYARAHRQSLDYVAIIRHIIEIYISFLMLMSLFLYEEFAWMNKGSMIILFFPFLYKEMSNPLNKLRVAKCNKKLFQYSNYEVNKILVTLIMCLIHSTCLCLSKQVSSARR